MQELFSYPENNGAQRANEQPNEATPRRRASPEHAKQEGCQQRGIDHGEQDLDIVHNTVEPSCQISGADAQDNPNHGDDTSHPQVVTIGRIALDVRAVDVVGPDRIEGGDVSGHARHKRGE